MGNVLAVARNTVKQALRMKIALVFIVLLLVILPLMAVSASGDGTIKGRLQTFVSYGLSLTSFLLCLLTIFTAIHTTTRDIVERQVYTVLTKPIRRYEYLCGKFVGILFLDLALLVMFCAGIYAVTVYGPDLYNASPENRLALADQFFTARTHVLPRPVEINDEQVDAEYQKLERSQMLDQYFEGTSERKIKSWLRKRIRLEKNAVSGGGELVWEFDHVAPADPNQPLFIRYKYDVSVTPPDEQVRGRWMVGDLRPFREGRQPTTPIYQHVTKDPLRTFREFSVPASVIAEDGYLAVGFVNPPMNQTVVIFSSEEEDQIEENRSLVLMYKADSFFNNYCRGVAVIFFRLIFLAGLATFASTFLSFPVAVLLSLVSFFTVSISGFVLQSFSYLDATLSKIYGNSIALLIKGLPQFDKYNPSTYLVDGRLMDWEMLNWASWTIIWAMLLLVLGLWIFASKELARDTS